MHWNLHDSCRASAILLSDLLAHSCGTASVTVLTSLSQGRYSAEAAPLALSDSGLSGLWSGLQLRRRTQASSRPGAAAAFWQPPGGQSPSVHDRSCAQHPKHVASSALACRLGHNHLGKALIDFTCRVEYAPFLETCKAALTENRNEYLALLKKCV